MNEQQIVNAFRGIPGHADKKKKKMKIDKAPTPN